jgi:ankyrin repeat protein
VVAIRLSMWQSRVLPDQSALMIACRYGFVDVIQTLVDAGASVDLPDKVRHPSQPAE